MVNFAPLLNLIQAVGRIVRIRFHVSFVVISLLKNLKEQNNFFNSANCCLGFITDNQSFLHTVTIELFHQTFTKNMETFLKTEKSFTFKMFFFIMYVRDILKLHYLILLW